MKPLGKDVFEKNVKTDARYLVSKPTYHRVSASTDILRSKVKNLSFTHLLQISRFVWVLCYLYVNKYCRGFNSVQFFVNIHFIS